MTLGVMEVDLSIDPSTNGRKTALCFFEVTFYVVAFHMLEEDDSTPKWAGEGCECES